MIIPHFIPPFKRAEPPAAGKSILKTSFLTMLKSIFVSEMQMSELSFPRRMAGKGQQIYTEFLCDFLKIGFCAPAEICFIRLP